MENKRIKYTSYLAGAIESASANEMTDWRSEVVKRLASPDLYFYNPIEQEANKVEKPSVEHVQYITGLKRAGLYEKFNEEMDKIWYGKVDVSKTELINVLIYLKEKAHLEGNYLSDFPHWGDFEAVARSNFIVVLLQKNVKTVGTYFEIRDAYLLEKPIYLILPDQSKTEANSSLLHVVMRRGEVFYTIKDCCDYIRDKYKLRESK